MDHRTPTSGPRISRRTLLRSGAASAAALAAGPLLSACEPTPGTRPAWRQSFTTPGSADVTLCDDGGWCWFSESRTVITPGGRLYAGTVAGRSGTAREGSIEISSTDVRGGLRAGRATRRSTVEKGSSTIGQDRIDDHNNPGLEVTAAGGVIAMWSAHGLETALHGGIDPTGSGAFTATAPIERPDSVTFPGRGVSYGSVHRLEAAGITFAAYRGEQYSWNLLRSTDDGLSWEPVGLIIIPPYAEERPYAKFTSDGSRLWFATTEGHPRDYQPTRIRVAAILPDGTITRSDGSRLGQVGPGVSVNAIPIAYNTPSNADAWVSEIRMAAGRPVVSASLRGQRVERPEGVWAHDHLRVMLDPAGSGTWIRELVAHGGGELGGNPDEPDYSGLAAVDPSTHNRFVVSTNVHPVNGIPLRSFSDGRIHFELWEMNRRSTSAGGWDAAPLTRDSTEDNIRPHIALRGGTKILSWMRGYYPSPHAYRTRIISRQAA